MDTAGISVRIYVAVILYCSNQHIFKIRVANLQVHLMAATEETGLSFKFHINGKLCYAVIIFTGL